MQATEIKIPKELGQSKGKMVPKKLADAVPMRVSPLNLIKGATQVQAGMRLSG